MFLKRVISNTIRYAKFIKIPPPLLIHRILKKQFFYFSEGSTKLGERMEQLKNRMENLTDIKQQDIENYLVQLSKIAGEYQGQYDFTNCLKCWEQILFLMREMKEEEGQITALRKIIQIYFLLNDNEKLLEYSLILDQKIRKDEEHFLNLQNTVRIGGCYYQLRRFSDAKLWYETAENIYDRFYKENTEEIYGDLFYTMNVNSAFMEAMDRNFEVLYKKIKESYQRNCTQTLRESKNYFESIWVAIITLEQNDEVAKAKQLLPKFKQILKQNLNNNDHTTIYFLPSVINDLNKDKEENIQILKQMMRRAKIKDDCHNEQYCELLFQLSLAHKKNKQQKEAISLLLESYNINEKHKVLPDERAALVLYALATTYHSMKQTKNSIPYFQRAYESYRKFGVEQSQTRKQILSILSNFYFESNQIDEMIRVITCLLREQFEVDEVQSCVYVYMNIVWLMCERKNIPVEEAVKQISYTKYLKQKDQNEIKKHLDKIIEMSKNLETWQSLKLILEASADILQMIPNHISQCGYCELMGQVCLQEGNIEQAKKKYEQGLKLLQNTEIDEEKKQQWRLHFQKKLDQIQKV